jgi:hypothetical protein
MASELAFEFGSVVVVSLVPDALPDIGRCIPSEIWGTVEAPEARATGDVDPLGKRSEGGGL